MFHLVAYSSVLADGAVTQYLAPVNDQIAFSSGNEFRVLPDFLRVGPGRFGGPLDAAGTYLQLQAPSLIGRGFHYVQPLNNALLTTTLDIANPDARSDLTLEAGEGISAYYSTTDGNGRATLLQTFLDAPVAPVVGEILTFRATGAATLVAGSWVNTAITLPTSLRTGRYALVGMGAYGTNLLAARIVFPTQEKACRPGTPGLANQGSALCRPFRYGALGVWGEFDTNNLFSVDCLGATDTTQVFIFDVMYLGN